MTYNLVLVEVIPIIIDIEDRGATDTATDDGTCTLSPTNLPKPSRKMCHYDHYPSPISAPLAKLQLINMSRQGMFSSKGWLDNNDDTIENSDSVPGARRRRRRRRARHSKQKQGSQNQVIPPQSNNNDDHQSTSTINPKRGLWLTSNKRHGIKCKMCHLKLKKEVQSSTALPVGSGQYLDLVDKPIIISGDLLFRGKDTTNSYSSSIVDTSFSSNLLGEDGNKEEHPSLDVSVTHLQSDDPLNDKGVPCYLRGYYILATNQANDDSIAGCCFCKTTRKNDDDHHQYQRAIVSSGTVVQISSQPFDMHSKRRRGDTIMQQHMHPKEDDVNLHAMLLGRTNIANETNGGVSVEKKRSTTPSSSSSTHYSKLSCYDPTTVEALALRMSTILATKVWIGTTPNALAIRKIREQELHACSNELDAFWEEQNNGHTTDDNIHSPSSDDDDDASSSKIQELCNNRDNSNNNTNNNRSNNPVPLLLQEGAILVYNSHSNSGKTTLVTTIAKDVLKCNAVHVISAPALFAKYGTAADAALESTLHELILQCAVKGGSSTANNMSAGEDDDADEANSNDEPCGGVLEGARICIVLDHLETFLPLSGQAGGDPYSPVLNAMAAYLNRVSFSTKTRNEFPFPSNNPLYNVCEHSGSSSSSGFTLPMGICLVGVTTCTESNTKGSIYQSALDAVGGGRFRVNLPSAATRVSALEHAFDVCGVGLAEDAKQLLTELAASATWACGGAFIEIARTLHSKILESGRSSHLASAHELKAALSRGGGRSKAEATSYTADFPSVSSAKAKAVTFSSVGGNVEAKLALEDALALDPTKRLLLAKFGLQLPTGVLLYGPPGTGKTLLARAVAQMLHSKGDNTGVHNTGGAFVALKASDIVRPEVGNSEKLIVSAFETARLNSPAVIFIDEFQALFGDRDGGGFILGQLASTLLQCMDDITRWSETVPQDDGNPKTAAKQSDSGRIVVLGATNTPWMIDKAFLRPGRFDRAVHVGLPGVEDSEEILRVHIARMKLATTPGGISPVDEISKAMSKLCLGFSGADLAALCRAAAVRCLSDGDGSSSGVTMQHFLDSFMHDVIRSSNDALVRQISSWQP